MKVLLLTMLTIWVALGQISTGTLTGIVVDKTDARVPNASVRVISERTGVTYSGATNVQGEYTIPLLPPDTYRATIQADGFGQYNRSGIVIEMGRTSRMDVGLEVGQTGQTVDVSANAPLLESETSMVSQFIENKTIVDMPLNGRRVADLVALMGNTILVQPDVNFPRVAVAGGRGDAQMWLLDGVTAQNVMLDVPQTNFNPPVESMQEFRVLQNGYSAEYGNTVSGIISFTTKSGTNKFHGSLYEYLRNDKLDARNFFAATKPPLRWNTFGFAIGGPIIRNRTFFFASTEWQRQRVGVTRLLTVPTAAERRGDFSATTNAAGVPVVIYDPATTRTDPATGAVTRTGFPGNVIPPGRLDPVGLTLAELYPLPNRAPANLAGANNFVANGVNGVNNTTLTVKGDHTFRESDRLSARFVLYDLPNYSTAVFPTAAADPFTAENIPREYSLLLNHIHTFTAAAINDFRFNWQPRRFTRRVPDLETTSWPQTLGLRGVPGRAFPWITLPGYTGLGNFAAQIQHDPRDLQFLNTLSFFRGSHALKIGGEARLGRFLNDESRLQSGGFNFGNQPTALPGTGNTGNPIASLVLGFPISGQVFDQDPLDRRLNYYSLFIQDDWKVTTSLTLNLGLRWDGVTPRVDANDRQNTFDPTAINPVSGTPGAVVFAGQNGAPRHIYRGQYANFGPRVGLAWRPLGLRSTVIRSGFGVFYGPPLPGTNNTSAGFEISGNFVSPDNGLTAPFLMRDGLPTIPRAQPGPGFGAVPVGTAPRFAPQFFDENRKLTYSLQWNFGIQHELGSNILVEAQYMANVSHRLPGPNTSINQVPPQLLGPGNAQLRRPFPQFADVVMIAPLWGNSTYHSLNLKIEKRFSHGLNFLGNYTFGKFIDDVSSNSEVGQIPGGIQNFYNRRGEKSLSGNDVRHRLAFSSVYELPFGTGRAFMNRGIAAAIVGGWNVGGIVVLQGGAPIGLVTQVNTTNAFNPGPQRVNLLRDPSLPSSERTLSRWFDTSAVAAPAPFTFGNAGRAVLRAPGIVNLDMSLLKNHRCGESCNVQFRAEAFNLPNKANFFGPGNALGSPNFGVISAARAARSIQLGLKFEF